MAPRVRRSLQELEANYSINPAPLDKVIRAFAALQAKPAEDPDSWFSIAACHGEPREADAEGNKPATKYWWGGYCAHGNVLFPFWHRAYLLRLEKALRRVPGCEDVDLPFWDECLNPQNPVPKILTNKTFWLDGKEIHNPLYSYTFVAAITDEQSPVPSNPDSPQMDHRYTKPKGYETKRFPLSGLVGTDQCKKDTEIWNQKDRWNTDEKRAQELNGNLRAWLRTDVVLHGPDEPIEMPTDRDRQSVFGRYKNCLNTPSYTIFSNTSTERAIPEWNPKGYISLESPHNSIHLAAGGFYQRGVYMANRDSFWEENRGANGDMGCNETASFDPIFFFHHGFIDYVFWLWQRKHGKTLKGSIDIDLPGAVGTNTGDYGQPGLPPHTGLTMNTPLYPFTLCESSRSPTPHDLVDIEGQLGYTYGDGSLDSQIPKETPTDLQGSLDDLEEHSGLHKYLAIENISSKYYRGSFVIRAYAITPSGKKWEVGREAVLGRWNTIGCGNCKSKEEAKAFVPIYEDLADMLREDEDYDQIDYQVDIQTSDPGLDFPGWDSMRAYDGPTIRDILPELRAKEREKVLVEWIDGIYNIQNRLHHDNFIRCML